MPDKLTIWQVRLLEVVGCNWQRLSDGRRWIEHCYECHAADSKIIQGGLRVDHRTGLLKGGDIRDNSPHACATVVDRLLESRAFGERWARHWLDLTGYADMIGTSNNVFAEYARRYRDYLIDAFNKDKSPTQGSAAAR
jgi:hypothetical protein